MGDEEVVAQAGTVDPESIPPADSNEELRIAHEKREAAFQGTVSGEDRKAAGAKRRAAAGEEPEEESRRTPPQGRTAEPGRQQTAVVSAPLVPADVTAPAGPAAEPPAVRADKAEWVKYAVSRGADRVTAEAMTQKQLVTEYGA